MVANDDPRVIDPEFAFFGPMGYDLGNVVAHLAFAKIRHRALGHDDVASRVDGYHATFWNVFVDETTRVWPSSEPWLAGFLHQVQRDSAQYAGLELIRRMVGLAHVRDIDDLPLSLRPGARRRIVDGARELLTTPSLSEPNEVWQAVTD